MRIRELNCPPLVILCTEYYKRCLIYTPSVSSFSLPLQSPADEHSSTNNSKDFKRTGKPNSSIDHVDEKGRIITRRWYDGNGRAKKDVDFTDHGNPKTHPEVPHEHTWKWDKDGNANRK